LGSTFTDNSKNTAAISFNFLWALSGLLAIMSLNLGSVTLLGVDISRVIEKSGLRRGIRALRALLFSLLLYLFDELQFKKSLSPLD